MVDIGSVILVLTATAVGAPGPVFFKIGARKLRFSAKSILFNHHFFIGAFFYFASTVIFIAALRGEELSLIYPFISLIYVWTSIISVVFLREKMNFLRISGIALIVAGVSLIGIGG